METSLGERIFAILLTLITLGSVATLTFLLINGTSTVATPELVQQ